MSSIPPALIDTYRNAVYRVQAPKEVVTFYIDKPSPELAELHREMDIQSSAFLTAYHPYSKPVSDEENEKAQQALMEELRSRGYRWLEGIGEDADGDWPGERSLLILGITQDEATALAARFKQNGYVYCGSDALPQLVLTR